jgi:hypothetical protein
LQIQLRGPEGRARASTAAAVAGADVDTVVLEQAVVERAIGAIREAFASASGAETGPSRLVKNLETSLDLSKEQWPPSTLRAMWEPLRESSASRERSPQHEVRWLNLAGYCLRPGTGYPLDENRMKALWPAWHAGVQHAKEMQCWVEWWVLWRRVAAGLNRAHQDELFRRLSPYLLGTGKKGTRPKPEPHEITEMWRCAAAQERLSQPTKESLGSQLTQQLLQRRTSPHTLWSLGRIGARVPLYGPANAVVFPDVASRWIETALAYEPENAREAKDLRLALAQMARVSGDRARDVAADLRERVVTRLIALGADESVITPVREFHELAVEQQSAALGDALPVGLRLLSEET